MSTRADQRLLVLLYVALLICLVHYYQGKSRTSQVKSNKVLVWLANDQQDGIYALPNTDTTYKNLSNWLDFPFSLKLHDKSFLPLYGKSYTVDPLSGVTFSSDNYKAAPLFFNPIPLNMTDADMLTTIPGVGPRLAEKIIQYREKVVAFKSTKELMNVKGIGRIKLKPLEKYVAVTDE